MNHTQTPYEQHSSSAKVYPVTFLAHNIIRPGNIGSLFRIADALGVEKIFLSGVSPCPPDKKIRRTSRSSEKYVAYEYSQDPVQIINELKNKTYKIVSLEITDNSIDIAELNLSSHDKVCLILGCENHGIPKTLLDLSDRVVHIPMLGANSSMNVADACSIATYEITQNIKPRL